MTNKQLAEEILQKVGGKKNINSYSHCSTRLRFDLKDKNSIDKAALERTDGILPVSYTHLTSRLPPIKDRP